MTISYATMTDKTQRPLSEYLGLKDVTPAKVEPAALAQYKTMFCQNKSCLMFTKPLSDTGARKCAHCGRPMARREVRFDGAGDRAPFFKRCPKCSKNSPFRFINDTVAQCACCGYSYEVGA